MADVRWLLCGGFCVVAARVLRCSVELSSRWLIWSSVGDGVLVPSPDPFVVVAHGSSHTLVGRQGIVE